jgi:hypothetical protein
VEIDVMRASRARLVVPNVAAGNPIQQAQSGTDEPLFSARLFRNRRLNPPLGRLNLN